MSTAFAGLTEISGAEPVFGHTRAMSRDRLGFMGRVSAEVDRLARLRVVLGRPAVFLNHPDTVHELLVERAREFDKAMLMRFALYPLVGEGLFTSRGELWRRQRRLMAPLFHPSRVAPFGADMVVCADRAMDEWGAGGERLLLRETTRIAMSVAGKTLFHADTFSEADEIGAALTTALEWVGENSPSVLAIGHLLVGLGLRKAGKLVPALARQAARFEKPVWLPGESGRRLRAAIELLDARVQRMIDERRAAPGDHADLLARLLEVRDDDDGQRMSDKQIRDEILTLFVAGHETTATALAWGVYLLCRNPEVMAAAVAEADALGRAPTVEDLPRLGLMLRIFKESLRLYPPVYLDSRQTLTGGQLEGVACPPTTVALFAPYALHRRPDVWPDPERFDPDRFLPAAEAQRSRYGWLPFGMGPRVCIGMGFALMEGQLVLARMLQRYRFESLEEDEPDPQATLRPRKGVRVRVAAREPANRDRARA